jgi:uncharacterized membrane protein
LEDEMLEWLTLRTLIAFGAGFLFCFVVYDLIWDLVPNRYSEFWFNRAQWPLRGVVYALLGLALVLLTISIWYSLAVLGFIALGIVAWWYWNRNRATNGAHIYTAPAPTTGKLELFVNNRTGARAEVKVTGPNGFEKKVSKSIVLKLKPGSYTVTANEIRNGSGPHMPVPATANIEIVAGTTSQHNVTYA